VLPVAVFRSRAANPDPVPTIYFQGGPGGSGLLGVVSFLRHSQEANALLGERDLIAFDQRGTGFAQPSLACQEQDNLAQSDPNPEILNPDGILAQPSMDLSVYLAAALNGCRDRLDQKGVNRAAYNTVTNAADVPDIVRALGYKQVNLWGISYGSRLALAVMRDSPQIVRSSVLDGVVPLDAHISLDVPSNGARAFHLLFSGCAASAACNAAFPRLEDRFYAMVRRLEDAPASVAVADPRTGAYLGTDRVRGRDVVDLVFTWMYNTGDIPYLPLLIDQWANGQYGTLGEALFLLSPQTLTSPVLSHSHGMQLSVNCADNAGLGSPETRAEIAASVRPELALLTEYHFENCAIWDVPGISPEQQQPLQSNIPTLVMSGELDPITPPAYGDQAAATLTNSHVFTLPGAGHGASLEPCGLQIMRAFWVTPGQPPDTSCIATLTGPEWVLPRGASGASALAGGVPAPVVLEALAGVPAGVVIPVPVQVPADVPVQVPADASGG
jgi:pimeloyl-ACP methyl ester carboxylesterase